MKQAEAKGKYLIHFLSFPDGSVGKESACNAGDPGSFPGLGSSPREGKGSPFQYSGLVHGVQKSRMQLSLSFLLFFLQKSLSTFYYFCLYFIKFYFLLKYS